RIASLSSPSPSSPAARKIRTAADASGDLGRVAGRPCVGKTTVSSTVLGVTGPDATGPSPATIGPYDVPGMPGGLPRRVLLRRNIVIDAETARLAGAAVQAV